MYIMIMSAREAKASLQHFLARGSLQVHGRALCVVNNVTDTTLSFWLTQLISSAQIVQ